MKRYYIAAVLITLFAVTTIIAQTLIGAATRRDRDRSDDLGIVRDAVSGYATSEGRMPTSLPDLLKDKDLKRPASEYSLTDILIARPGSDSFTDSYQEAKYKMCATFETRTGSGDDSGYDFSDHPKGPYCFRQTENLR